MGCAAQEELGAKPAGNDSFAHYASMYDELIGRPCVDGFMASRRCRQAVVWPGLPQHLPEEVGKRSRRHMRLIP
jgi:hypothetical protein